QKRSVDRSPLVLISTKRGHTDIATPKKIGRPVSVGPHFNKTGTYGHRNPKKDRSTGLRWSSFQQNGDIRTSQPQKRSVDRSPLVLISTKRGHTDIATPK